MKKGWMCLGLSLALIAALAGCGGTQSTPPESESTAPSVVVPSSLVPSGPSVPGPETDALAQAVADEVNRVLAGYASGSLPEPITYHTDFFGIVTAPPPGAVLPQSVTAEDMMLAYEENEMWGGWTVIATVILGNDFSMDVYLRAGGEDAPETVEVVNEVIFRDWQDTLSVEHAALKGAQFIDMSANRSYAMADFAYESPQLGQLDGNLSWDKGTGLVWIYYTKDRSVFYTYYLQADGSLVEDYPGTEWPGYPELNSEVVGEVSAELFGLFCTALEENGLPT